MGKIEKPPFAGELSTEILDILIKHGTLISEINTTYPYWNKAKHLGKKDGIEAKNLWHALKFRRAANGLRLLFKDNFMFNITPSLQRDLHELDMHCGGSLQSIATVPDNLRERFIISSLMLEAYSSSVIEGAVSTKDRAKELIRAGKKPLDKSEQMILNNYYAMSFIRTHKNEALSENLLQDLHTVLGKDALEEGTVAGQYRTQSEGFGVYDDLAGERIYIPPPAEQVPERMRELIHFFNYKEREGQSSLPFVGGKDAFVHPIIRATIIHFLIGYIHPFADGNGRMARALFYWHMLRNEYWLAEYLSISQVILDSKDSYYNSFIYVEQDGNDLTYFLQYHTRALMIAFEKLKEYLHRKLNMQRIDIADEALKLDITPRQAELLTAIKKSPTIWTVAQAEKYLKVSHATARGDLNALAEKGLLQKVAIDKKTQAWRLP